MAKLSVQHGCDNTPTSLAGAEELHFLSEDELAALPPPAYLIDGLIEAGSFAVLFGPPAHGKTFLALDVALSVTTGMPCLGQTVEPGRVAYVAAEGVRQLPRRIDA